ncbi:helix-turn-helix transcriptional regulator [Prosthecomicrobium sp. N25]|uniref:helix-turn-helix transcriptional regulator n=1 Tax=Prosthecomicrobium sp. N25 TaxID=3129254 RepID=UPI0030786DB9
MGQGAGLPEDARVRIDAADDLQIVAELSEAILAVGADPTRADAALALLLARLPGLAGGLSGRPGSALESLAALAGEPGSPGTGILSPPPDRVRTGRADGDGPALAVRDGPDAIRILAALRPSLRAALRLGGPNSVGAEAGLPDLRRIVEAMPLPCLAVDGVARILGASPSAIGLLAGTGPLADQDGRLVPRGPALPADELTAAIHGALRPGATEHRLPVRDPSGRLRGLVCVAPPACPPPVPGEAPAAPAGFVVVVLRGFDPPGPELRRSLADVFGLTPSEAEISLRLANGQTLAELSNDLGISTQTARKHVNNIFDKTGCRRQAELVAKVLLLA